MNQSHAKCRAAFTLVEMLVVIGITSIALSLLIGVVQRARESSNRVVCMNNLRQLAQSVHTCNDTNKSLPPLSSMDRYSPIYGAGPYNGSPHTMFYFLLPYIEETPIHHDEPGRRVIKTFLCPSEIHGPYGNHFQGADEHAISNYVGNYLVFGDPNSGSPVGAAKIPETFHDGTSNTIIFAERIAWCGPNAKMAQSCLWNDAYGPNSGWYFRPSFCDSSGRPGYRPCPKFVVRPRWSKCNPSLASTNHQAGMNVAFADGSVHMLMERISLKTWQSLSDPRDGHAAGSDW